MTTHKSNPAPAAHAGLDELTAVSPVDGRYRSKTALLAPYFSELALMRYRIRVEVEYFIALCELPLPALRGVDSSLFPALRAIYEDFNETGARRIKEIEGVTNHDVKAIEYYIKEHFDVLGGLAPYKEFVHFGLTSQDINNTAFPMMLREALLDTYLPALDEVRAELDGYAREWAAVPMLARTHGQPASPTTLGKEVRVFGYRLERLRQRLAEQDIPAISGKFGGATGNFNAHHVAYPGTDWQTFANRFLTERLGIQRELVTTQISNYDNLCATLDTLRRIHTVLIDLDRDFWQYISMGYFRQRIKPGEVGSSAMPHKVNPIDFENSEGNLGVANALLEHLSAKLPISRLQRDLTDSTVLRNVGVPLAHAHIALSSTLKGLRKLLIDETVIRADLAACWPVVAEAIQTILRREGYPQPYETLKQLTRTNEPVNEQRMHDFISTLQVSQSVKEELLAITPTNYTGEPNNN
ncbi:MAG: adenylosuccinate lyase [Alloprevotella sp.]|nr:adenylosuccinate lyase [Alloprevotella sp.]